MTNLVKEKRFLFEVPEGKKKVKVNGKPAKANYKIRPNDIIEAVHPITPRPEYTEPENIPIDIIYEDEYLIVVNKPAGMVTHPAYGNYTGTLVNALLHHTSKLSELNQSGRPGIIHRLDKNTSGLLVVAKDDFTHAEIAKQFSKRTIEREYHTICWGHFKKKSGEVSSNITRSTKDRKKFSTAVSKGKPSLTLFEVIEEFEFTTYLKVKLKTGRTHQ